MFIRYLDISDLNDPCASVAAFDICQDPVAKLGRLRSAEAGRFGALCPRQMAMNYKKCPEERHAGCSPDRYSGVGRVSSAERSGHQACP